MPCLRFAAGPGIPPCKENGMAWCQTDLAANVYRYQRWIQEDMQYGRMDSGVGVSHDGRMADLIQKKGWPVSSVAGSGDTCSRHSVQQQADTSMLLVDSCRQR
jgi:hypothetical protein